jgi:glyoxylase-like metal-dependent hydrolase (beta-lactamase superfamily II)
MAASRIERLLLGWFSVPEIPGAALSQWTRTLFAFLIRHPDGLLLWDTGIGVGDAESEARYRPHRESLDEALKRIGIGLGDIDLVANCHLHFDHCGNNRRFPDTPILAQRVEHAAAREPDYTMPDVAEFPGARYELSDGETEPFPGVRIVPTPGHSPGHQSLVVETAEGVVVLAGQAMDTVSEWASADFTLMVGRGTAGEGIIPAWLPRIRGFEPRRVLFAHDPAIWEAA